MANELPTIKTPQEFVQLFLQNPEVCGEGLKELLDVTPDIFDILSHPKGRRFLNK